MKSNCSARSHPPAQKRQSRRHLLRQIGGLASLPILVGVGSASAKTNAARVGFLSVPPSGSSPVFGAFQEGLRDLGYVQGQNISIEWRGAEGHDEQLPRLAAEVATVGVDVIVAETYPAIVAAQKAAGTVPIVMAVSSDPIETGLVASLSKPGGNITGLTTLSTELNRKRLQMLKEAVPGMSRLALVWASLAAPDKELGLKEARRAAQELGFEIQYIEIRKSQDWEEAVQAVLSSRPAPDAVF